MPEPADAGNHHHSRQLHALFPTLVFQERWSNADHWTQLFRQVQPDHSFPMESGPRGCHFAGEYHGQILLHGDERLNPFFVRLTASVGDYVKELGMQPNQYRMHCLKTWFVICDPIPEEDSCSEALLPHNHSCSDVSWVYFVDVPSDCPPITFCAPDILRNEPFGSAFHYDWQNEEKSSIRRINAWNRTTWSIVPAAGDLLIFPGHLVHSVAANHTDQRRISVAGDISLTVKPEFLDREYGRTAPEHWRSCDL